MFDLKDIKEISYLPKEGIVTIYFNKRIFYKNYMRDSLNIKASHNKFIDMCEKFINYKEKYKN